MLAEMHHDVNAYNYVLNNPLTYYDPMGLDTVNANTVKPADWRNFDTGKDIMALSAVTVTPEKPKAEENQETDLHYYSQFLRKRTGSFKTAYLPFEQAFLRSTMYSAPKSGSTTLIIFEKQILGKKIIHQPLLEMGTIKAGRLANGLKLASRVAGVAGVGLAAYDMAQNGISYSNTLDLTMSGLPLTGFGSGVAGAYFIANAATIYFTDKDIGQHIGNYIKEN